MPVSLTNHLDLSKLKWIKVIHDPSGWAYTRERIKTMPRSLDFNGVTLFPLGFRTEKAITMELADQLALIQRGKLTHIVEIMDREPYQEGDWYNRICRVLWWEPEVGDLQKLQRQKKLLGFDPALQDGDPHAIENLKRFNKTWSENGGLERFRDFLGANLQNL